uniref:Kelch-like protein 12 n=1 Tax=Phallusia mammillata TaxID=59560 RepID=A0A6F9DGM0_9ASCI|nr:kelch-like protein 12 [Phallusia mammillata]
MNYNCKLESYKTHFGEKRTAELSPMKFGRSHFALVAYEGFLFAIGGYRSSDAFCIEVYSIQTNTWETLAVTGPDIFNVRMHLVHQTRAYVVHGNDTIQVSTFDLERRQWVSGMNAETRTVERCASLTLGHFDFVSCTMGPPLVNWR